MNNNANFVGMNSLILGKELKKKHVKDMCFFTKSIGLPLEGTISKNVVGTQAWYHTIVERAKDKGTPCWIQTNDLLTANEVLLPTELQGPCMKETCVFKSAAVQSSWQAAEEPLSDQSYLMIALQQHFSILLMLHNIQSIATNDLMVTNGTKPVIDGNENYVNRNNNHSEDEICQLGSEVGTSA